jgi:hypothetical protein
MTLDRRGLLATGLALALGGCAGRGGVSLVAGAGAGAAGLETLRSVAAGPKGLTIRVASSGCVRKEDFAFYVDRTGVPPTIAFARKRLETCHAATPGEAALTFTYQELGVADRGRLAVLNPLAVNP